MSNKVLVSGFTFIKNGLSLGYPIKESIESIEPLCDEVIINVGFDDKELKKDDGTYNYLKNHFTHKKFKFLKSYWDPRRTEQGLVLSDQTNIALKECQGSICQYIQGDEVLHEKDLHIIHDAHMNMIEDPTTEGIVFNFTHFYGNTNVIKKTRNTYRSEVRTVRNLKSVVSHLDAQGFRHQDGRKLNCRKINAGIYHYGWARPTAVMKKKIKAMDKLYHGQSYDVSDKFSYKRIWGLRPFSGQHPIVVQEWVKQNQTELDILSLKMHFEFKDLGLVFSDFVESLTGIRIGEYKNYKLI